jgi:hypothetical protein
MDPKLLHELVLQDGQRISGTLSDERIVVPEGVTVCVEDDVRLRASDEILVQGTLRCLDRSSDDRKANGPLIELVSERSIVVLGAVRGGKGQSYDELPRQKHLGREGGPGSSILLQAPSITIAGAVTAGNGGNAGRGGQGGSGGSVCRIGSNVAAEETPGATCRSRRHRRRNTGQGRTRGVDLQEGSTGNGWRVGLEPPVQQR